MANPEYQRLISEARVDLVTHMAEYVRGQQMPVHLTGELLTPQQELGKLQEVYRRMYMLRERMRLFGQLFQCYDCDHLEGEHHANDCSLGRGVITRPKNWTAPPPSEPAEVMGLRQVGCASPTCPYTAPPGSTFCAQHVEGAEVVKEVIQEPRQKEESRVRPDNYVTAKEAIELMQRIIDHKVSVVEAGPDETHHVSRVFITGEGHRLQFFNDANELDYLEAIRFPDGREGEYDDWCPPLATSVYNPADDIDDQALMRVLQW